MFTFIVLMFAVTFGLLISTLIMAAVSIMLLNNDGVIKRYCKWFVNYMRKCEEVIEEVMEEEESK